MDRSPTGEYVVIRRIVDNSRIDEVKMPLEEFRKLIGDEDNRAKYMSAKLKMFLLKL